MNSNLVLRKWYKLHNMVGINAYFVYKESTSGELNLSLVEMRSVVGNRQCLLHCLYDLPQRWLDRYFALSNVSWCINSLQIFCVLLKVFLLKYYYYYYLSDSTLNNKEAHLLGASLSTISRATTGAIAIILFIGLFSVIPHSNVIIRRRSKTPELIVLVGDCRVRVFNSPFHKYKLLPVRNFILQPDVRASGSHSIAHQVVLAFCCLVLLLQIFNLDKL